MIIEIIAIVLVIGTILGSYYFYRGREGIKSIYKSSYSGIIDFIAFLSGLYIITITFVLYYKGVSMWLLLPLFLSGNLQGSMHIAKWYLRNKIYKK